MKLYVKIIESCPDCPYCNWQIDKDSDSPLACEHSKFKRVKTWWLGRPTTVQIPSWCPLPNSNEVII